MEDWIGLIEEKHEELGEAMEEAHRKSFEFSGAVSVYLYSDGDISIFEDSSHGREYPAGDCITIASFDNSNWDVGMYYNDNEVLLLNLEDALTKEQLADYCKTFLEYESDEELSIESRIGWICKNARSTYSKIVDEAIEEIINETNYDELLNSVKECIERGDI